MTDEPWKTAPGIAVEDPDEDGPWKVAPGIGGAPAAVPPAGPQVGYGEDIAKGAAGGLGRGVAGALGLPGTIGSLYRKGLSKLGVPDEYLDTGAKILRHVPLYGALAGPDAGEVTKAIESQTGKFYEPKTIPGQYASTIAEFAPGMAIPGGGGIGARVLNTVAPAVISETAGQVTKDTPIEPWARGIAGVAGGLATAKLVTPTAPQTPQRARAVGVLEREGIPLSAGERTGSRSVQWAESTAGDMPFSSGRASDMKAAQANAYDRAVTERLFDRNALTNRYPPHDPRHVPPGVNLPDPRVSAAGRATLEDEYGRLTQGNQLRSDQQLQNELTLAQRTYENRVLPSQRGTGARDVEELRNDITDKLVTGRGRMSGEDYQAIRSRFGTLAKSVQNNDPYLAGALRDMRGALDRAMQRGLSPDDAAAWLQNNQRWGNMRQLEGAVARAGENLSPAGVAQVVRAGRPGQYNMQTGNLDELTQAAATVMKPLPNSGTAIRTGWQNMFNAPSMLSTGTGGVLGSVFGPLGALAGAALPHAAARAVLSRGGQAYLGNQAIPQNARDVVAQTLLQQAIAQPGQVERNQKNRQEYEDKREEERVKQGLPPTRITVNPRAGYYGR